MAFDNQNKNTGGNDKLDPVFHLDNTNVHPLQTQAAKLMGDPHLMAAATTAGKHMTPGQAAAWGLAGFGIAGHDSPGQNQAAIAHGNDVASRVSGATIATEGDLAAALNAYGDISGNILTNPEGSFAQGNLAGAIQKAQSQLDIQRAAGRNGTGDNPYAAQSQFATAGDYQAFVDQQAALRNTANGDRQGTQQTVNDSQTVVKRVVSTVGNSTMDSMNASASYTQADGLDDIDRKKSNAA